MSDDSYEYRACATDVGDYEPDYTDTHHTLAAAHHALRDLMECVYPPYDEGWVERRVCTDWERIT